MNDEEETLTSSPRIEDDFPERWSVILPQPEPSHPEARTLIDLCCRWRKTRGSETGQEWKFVQARWTKPRCEDAVAGCLKGVRWEKVIDLAGFDSHPAYWGEGEKELGGGKNILA